MNKLKYLLFLSIGFSTTLVVPTEYPTIFDGLNASSEGDTVLILDGLYSGVGNVGIEFLGGPDIVLISESGPANCIIDCNYDGRWLYLGNSSWEIIGFTIKNGMSDEGGALRFYGYGEPQIDHCIFYNNTSTWIGGAVSIVITDPTFKNCVFYGNTSLTTAGDIIGDALFSHIDFYNSILVGHNGSAEYGIDLYYSCSLDTVGSSGTLREGAFIGDPLMVDPELGNFTLQLESPCINAGNPDDPHDFDNTRIDIGVSPFILELLGDANFDGVVDVLDVVVVVEFILYDLDSYNAQLWAMNINLDDDIDIIDIVLLVDVILN